MHQECARANLWVRAIDESAAVNSLPECLQALPWKIYAEAKTKRITSNNRNLKVAQDILGHRHLETTADIYASTDQRAMIEAVSAAKSLFAAEQAPARQTTATEPGLSQVSRYVFAYDDATLQELDQTATQRTDIR